MDNAHDDGTMNVIPMIPPHAQRDLAKFTGIYLSITPEVYEHTQDEAYGATTFRAFLAQCLLKHHRGDWGDLDDSDKAANEAALLDGSRIFSCYILPFDHIETPDKKIYIITEATDDPTNTTRELTTILFPSEY